MFLKDAAKSSLVINVIDSVEIISQKRRRCELAVFDSKLTGKEPNEE